jgi:hypothetical protein
MQWRRAQAISDHLGALACLHNHHAAKSPADGFASGLSGAPRITQGRKQPRRVAAINPIMHQEASDEGGVGERDPQRLAQPFVYSRPRRKASCGLANDGRMKPSVLPRRSVMRPHR